MAQVVRTRAAGTVSEKAVTNSQVTAFVMKVSSPHCVTNVSTPNHCDVETNNTKTLRLESELFNYLFSIKKNKKRCVCGVCVCVCAALDCCAHVSVVLRTV